jgi:hypothetical protein
LCAKRRAEDEVSSVVDVLVASCVVAAAIFAIAAAAAAMAVGAVLAYSPFPHILKTGKQSNPNPNPNPLSVSLSCCFSLFLFVGGFMSRSKFLPRWFFSHR